MKKIFLIGLALCLQLLQANEEKTIELRSGYNAVYFDANITLSSLKDKMDFDDLLSIQGAGQGATYKEEYVEDGLEFLNSFTQTGFGKGYWIQVSEEMNVSYVPEVHSGTKTIDLTSGWNFVGSPLLLTLEEIKNQLGSDNVLVIQGAGQGRSYKKSNIDNGVPFLNSFSVFEEGQAYWIKVKNPASFTLVFSFETIAKDNSNNNAEIVKNIDGKEYTIRVYSDKTPKNETSNSTIAVYGNVNGQNVTITLNDSYSSDAKFQVRIFDMDGNEITRTAILDYGSTIQFSNLTLPDNNPCISLADLKTKIANNEDVTGVNTGCITDMSHLFKDNATFNQDISGWDVSKITDMTGMFAGVKSFNQDIGRWNVSQVTQMVSMFTGAESFNQDIGTWDVSKVADMDNMFSHAESFSSKHYDALLNGWSQRTLQNAVFFDAPPTQYSSNATASRQHIIDAYKWTIVDAGLSLSVQELAQAKIEAYTQSNNNAKPTLQDYIDAGVVGVTAENLDAVNTAVANATQEEVDTLAELNALVASLDDIKAKIVERHNFYRNLEFQDSNLTWDETLANHAQQWAEYLVANYTASDRASGVSPHASAFNKGHGLLYEGEGENIAWSSNGRGYLTPEPVDIMVPNAGDGGSIDAWANEKANYDYVTNSTTDSNLAIGHYTQVVWQKTTKVGCGKASGEDGEHVVCRYYIAGNLTGTKPYCTQYSVASYYNDSTLQFTPTIINSQTFSNTKMIEDRVNCSISETTSETLSFNDDGTGVFQSFDFFNDGGYVINFNFNSVLENGLLKMSGVVNNYNAVMTLKLIGQDADYYYSEAEWSLDKDRAGFFRRGLFKLAK